MSNAKTSKTKMDTVDIDPDVLLDCMVEVDDMVNAHVTILKAVKRLIWKFKKAGQSPEQAAAIAFTLHKRASEKANKMVPNGEPMDDEMEDRSDSEGKVST